MASSHSLPDEKGKSKRRLFVMRHGERCDFTFGRGWITHSFDSNGSYTQKDLNLPVSVVKRQSPKDFVRDSPLTEIGRYQGRVTGEALKKAEVNIQHVYVSPALRCVQTAQAVLDGMGRDTLSMGIEPSAFEWLGWYKNAFPVWLTPKQMADEGFSIDDQHKPFVAIEDLNPEENIFEYYSRCQRLAMKILEKHKDDDGDILIVAHAGTLDTLTRQLQGKPSRVPQEMHNMLSHFSYCCLCCCVEEAPTVWKLCAPPIPPLQGFDWKIMI